MRTAVLHLHAMLGKKKALRAFPDLLADGSPIPDGVGRLKGDRGFEAIRVDVESRGGPPLFPVMLSVMPCEALPRWRLRARP